MRSMTSHQRPWPHHLLQRLPQLQHQRHLQTTAVKSVWSGSETASHWYLAATRGSAVPVLARSSAWGLAVQSVAPTFIWLCEFTTDTEHWTLLSSDTLLRISLLFDSCIVCDDELHWRFSINSNYADCTMILRVLKITSTSTVTFP